MKIISSTLTPVVETITDPGSDYPNGAASSAEPSYRTVTRIDGFVEIEIEDPIAMAVAEENPLTDGTGNVEYQFGGIAANLWAMLETESPMGIKVTKWSVAMRSGGNTPCIIYRFEVAEFDASQFTEPEFEEE